MKNMLTTAMPLAAMILALNVSANELAPFEQALTLAQIKNDLGQNETLLVVEDTSSFIKAVNLSQLLGQFPDDALNLFATQDYDFLKSMISNETIQSYSYESLLPAGGMNDRSIAAGTNYKEHGEEADIDEVFLFPKYSMATPAVTSMEYNPNGLLDYEVELCMRWSEDIHSIQQAKANKAGLFVCGDMTDRAALLRNLNLDDIASGHGFTDAKSGKGRFPTGPYIVVPRDWSSFVNEIKLSTWVNGELRQSAWGREMIKPPLELTGWILDVGAEADWRFQQKPVSLLASSYIRAGQNLITGTPEGVVFNAPGLGYQVSKGLKWIATFSFLDSSPLDFIIDEYIGENLGGDRYLKAGDQVQFSATYLGRITLDIIE